MNGKRITVVMSNENVAKVRKIQAKRIASDTERSHSFSEVVNDLLEVAKA